MAFGNPFEAIIQARQRKDQQTTDAMNMLSQAIAQASGNFAQGYQQHKQKQQWQKSINEMMNNPNLSPQMKSLFPLIAQNPDLASSIIPRMMTNKLGGAGKRVVYQNADGTVSLTPTEGATPLEVSDAQAMQYTATPASAKARNDAMKSRSEAWNRSIDVHQIDLLAKSTGITPKQQSALQQNNLRADRALTILGKDKLTWQELALGEIDLAGIMQGGVPHVDEVKASHFPGWQEQWAQWKTYATGHPTENVPDPIRKKVQKLVGDVVQIDNKFLQANAKFNQQMIAPTIRGGIQQFKGPINEMTSVLTSQPSSNNQGFDAQKEARYQAWKKAHGY